MFEKSTALILRSKPEACVSKDVPGGSGASANILRDAIPKGMASQDEGFPIAGGILK